MGKLIKYKKRGKIFCVAAVITVGSLFFNACGNSQTSQKGQDSKQEKQKEEKKEEGKEKEVKVENLKEDYEPSAFEETDVESDTIYWMCSAYAIYSQYNDKRLDVVGGLSGEDKEWYQDSVKIALAEGWGIMGRDEVEKTVEKLVNHGHREEYRKVIKEMKDKKLLELSKEEAMKKIPDDENQPRYETAYEAYEKYGEAGIDGWDYSRALQILGDCYQAEYINLQECLDMSLPIARKLQETYDSWEGVAESYLYGYSFWKKELPTDYDSQERWDIYEELKSMEQGPYTLAYDTVLEDTWSNAEERIQQKARQEEEDLKAGYVPLTCEEEPKGLKIRLPKEYVWDEEYESSTGRIVFETFDETGADDITVFYDMESLREYPTMAETKKESALMSENTAKELTQEQGGTMESSGVQTRQVGDLEVNYMMIYETYPNYHLQKIRYITWTSIEGKYLLECEAEESVQEGQEMKLSKDPAILDTLLGDVKW